MPKGKDRHYRTHRDESYSDSSDSLSPRERSPAFSDPHRHHHSVRRDRERDRDRVRERDRERERKRRRHRSRSRDRWVLGDYKRVNLLSDTSLVNQKKLG